MAAVPISKCELDFTLQALRRENVRIDGRALTAYRRFGLRFGAAHGEVEVNFGPSRAQAVCSGEIVTPPPERPNEGRIAFHVEFGPMASPNFEAGRPSVQATTASNFIERLLRGSRAIDTEALCIVGGQKVWSIRVDVRALDDDGNLLDVCSVAALCALLHFRKADVSVHGDSAQVFSAEERVPVPLSIHHIPIPVTFALYEAEKKDAEPTWILDPNRLEESAMGGALCVAVNQHGEICALHKPGGLPVDYALVEHCVELATARAKELTGRIQGDLEADLSKRQQKRRNVHQQYASAQLLTVDWSEEAIGEEAPAAKLELAKPKPVARAPVKRPKPAAVSTTAVAPAPKPGPAPAAVSATAVAPAVKLAPARSVAVAATPSPAPSDVGREAVAASTPGVAALADVLGGLGAAFAGTGSDASASRDLAAELAAVEAEAAELEALLAAAASEDAPAATAAPAEASIAAATVGAAGVVRKKRKRQPPPQ